MIVNTYMPKSLSALRLDRFLAGGWFRSAFMLYRTQCICIDNDIWEIINIRIDLRNYTFKKRFQKILNKYAQQFEVRIQKFENDSQKEALYRQHRWKFKGFVFDTLHDFLYASANKNQVNKLFDTYEVSVYDKGKLIATSIFDLSSQALTSLLGLYTMEYPKHSLGLYTMLLEIQFGIVQQKKWYYPGYIMEGNSDFDYKLQLGGSMQFYDWRGRWKNINMLAKQPKSLSLKIKEKIADIQAFMQQKGIVCQRRLYPFFSLGHSGWGYENPIFLEVLQATKEDKMLIIDYDAKQDLIGVRHIIKAHPMDMLNMSYSEELAQNPAYCLHYLDYENYPITYFGKEATESHFSQHDTIAETYEQLQALLHNDLPPQLG